MKILRLDLAAGTLLGIAIIIVGFRFLVPGSGAPDSNADVSHGHATSGSSISENKPKVQNRKVHVRGSGERHSDSDSLSTKLIREWSQKTIGLSGQQLLEEQWRIARKAAELLHGMEMAHFFDSIKGSANVQVLDWLMAPAVSAMMSSLDGPEVKVWLASLKDGDTRGKMLHYAGCFYVGDDAQAFLSTLSTPKDKGEFLAGLCVAIAATNPEQAVAEFIEKRPDGVGFEYLKKVMNVIPEGADYAGISLHIPSDERSVAREIRSELLATWARSNPSAAAQFVISGDENVDPSQLKVVLNTWISSSPDQANGWVVALPEGDYRDIGLDTVARSTAAQDPERAWELALLVRRAESRERTIREIHSLWMKVDPRAAEEAKKKYIGKK